jgi:hypothetical protein
MPNVPDSTLELIYVDIVESLGYKTTVGPIDKSKVARRYAGEKTELPSARLARAAWRVAAILKPLVPPPPTFKYVAPRVAYAQGGSDARYCLWAGGEGGALQPGLTWIDPDNHAAGVRDQVAQYDLNGLCRGSERSPGSAADGIVGSREINDRPLCSLPMTGQLQNNTGSWLI